MPQSIPYGNAFLVHTPEIDQARNQIFAQQQQRRMFQQQELQKLDPVMDREFSRIRSVDVPAFTDAYSQYKNVAKQQLFDPRAQRDPQYYQQLNQQKNEALANVFSIADKSSQYNQMGKDLMTTRRTHPDVYDDSFGDKMKTLMNTPYDQLEKTQYGDLSNPDNFRYQHTIDFNKIHAAASGKPKDTYSQTTPTSDGLSNTINTYQYGANPKQYHDNFVNQLAKLPTGEREAASAMQHFTPEMVDEINKQYYAPNPDKWNRTTGQPNPMPVEAQNPNSAADQYGSLMAKLTWLNANTPSPTKVQTTPNRGAIRSEINTQQEKMQQNRFTQEKLMERIKNGDIVARDDLRRLHDKQDAAGQDDLVNGYFDSEVKKGTPIEIPTNSGTPLKGIEINPVNAVKKELGSKADKYISSDDGKTWTGVYLQRDPKTKAVINKVDDTKTNQKDVDIDLKTPYRNFIAPKSKIPVPTAAPKVPVQGHAGMLNDIK